MKKNNLYLLVFTFVLSLFSMNNAYCGNEQRAGSAGAPYLLINPWAASSALGSSNSASIKGLEALSLNVAGTAFTENMDIIFTSTAIMANADVRMNNFGFSKQVGEGGVISLAFQMIDYGEINRTTGMQPDGGIGTFHPSTTVISLAYAKAFSNSIYGGFNIKLLNEGITNATASGVAIDAGIQYVTGIGKDKAGNRQEDNFHFGISMQNVGPTMGFSGDGLSFRGLTQNKVSMTVEQKTTFFELPSLIRIGSSYSLDLTPKVDSASGDVVSDYKMIISANFTSNSFTKDQFHAGIEMNIKDILFLRGGYVYEKGMNSASDFATAYSGPSAGVSVKIPLNKEKGTQFSVDYAYRQTISAFAGTHTIGARITL